jgi:signal transduction histidine kinase
VLRIKSIFHYKVIIAALVILGLYLTSFYSYDLFHSLAEIFAIVIACGLFMLVWNARRFMDNNFFLVIGIAFLFVGGLDYLHTLAYQGVNIFLGHGADLPTQLWIAARYLQAAALLIAPFFVNRKVNLKILIPSFAGATGLVILSIFWWHIFPHAYIDGVGLTQFKIISEYIVSAVLIAGIVLIYRERKFFDRNVLILLSWSVILTVVSELFFTSYVSVFSSANMIGHLVRIVAFALLYEAVIVKTIVNPFQILFRGLKESEVSLRDEVEVRKKAQTELAESKQHHDNFLFQTIHDMRSPLSVIQTTLDSYKSQETERQNREFDKDIKLVERANNQLINLITDLFSVASGEKTEIIFRKQKLNPTRVVKEIIDDLRPIIKNKKINVEHEQPPKGLTVIADSKKLSEAMINIIDNAIKYNNPEGTIKIKYEKEGDFVKIIIRDTGIGISDHDMTSIFKPYYRSSFVKNTDGTGLGLYIVKKFIEKMNGKIEISSGPGIGTTVEIYLPSANPQVFQ